MEKRSLAAAAPWLATIARLGLGATFVVAGVLKLPDPAAAVRAVRAYQLLPEALVGPVAFGLPMSRSLFASRCCSAFSCGRRPSCRPSC